MVSFVEDALGPFEDAQAEVPSQAEDDGDPLKVLDAL